jgi:hypothetical protein
MICQKHSNPRFHDRWWAKMIPLILQVLGFFLCNIKELEMWEGALSKLKSGQSFTGGHDN